MQEGGCERKRRRKESLLSLREVVRACIANCWNIPEIMREKLNRRRILAKSDEYVGDPTVGVPGSHPTRCSLSPPNTFNYAHCINPPNPCSQSLPKQWDIGLSVPSARSSGHSSLRHTRLTSLLKFAGRDADTSWVRRGQRSWWLPKLGFQPCDLGVNVSNKLMQA